MAFIDFPTFKKGTTLTSPKAFAVEARRMQTFDIKYEYRKGRKSFFFPEQGTEGEIRVCGKAIQRRSRTLTSGRFVRAELQRRGLARFSLTGPHKSWIFISFSLLYPDLQSPHFPSLPPFSYRIPWAPSPKSIRDISFARLSAFVLANAAESRLSGKERRCGEIYRSCGLLRGL